MKPFKRWSLIGALVALLAGAGIAVAQLPNTLNISSAASGSAPAVRASGVDANININLVPKGSGTVQIGGSPIAVSGGTVTSFTVDPGPLNVNGALLIEPGTSATLKAVGARIFHSAADAPTVGTVLETLYTASLAANALAVDGQSIRIKAVATTAANGNNKTFLITFGATTIFTSTAAAFNNDYLQVICDLFRTGAATQKAFCAMYSSELGAITTTINSSSNLTTPAETLTGAVAILFRGTTPTAAADLTARYATIDWYPVGQ